MKPVPSSRSHERRAGGDLAVQLCAYFCNHVTDSPGNILDDRDFLPFGDERCGPSSSGNNYKFTEMEYDSESSLDHTLFRQYASNYGRWMSPDEYRGGPTSAYGPADPAPPGALPYADISNPQSLNKYGYTYNNPQRGTLTQQGAGVGTGSRGYCWTTSPHPHLH